MKKREDRRSVARGWAFFFKKCLRWSMQFFACVLAWFRRGARRRLLVWGGTDLLLHPAAPQRMTALLLASSLQLRDHQAQPRATSQWAFS